MGIVVPILRTAFVLLNIYETFKTLKLPPPSARNGGQPSVRAMSQRKRNMKGCMSVWLIWFCYAFYERTADGFVSIFIPFYSEIKSIIILFFILTRAKGAEPIYLHILRPLVKPYTGTLDALLNIGHQLGDVALVFAAIPFHFVSSYYHRWTGKPPTQEATPPLQPYVVDSVEGEEAPVIPPYPADLPADPALAYGATRNRQRPLEGAHQRVASKSAPPNKPQIYATSSSQKIWKPPASAFNDSPPSVPQSLPTPPAEPELNMSQRREIDEWRQYEPFPSAYPVSPVQATAQLPSLAAFGGIYAAPADPPPAYSRNPSSGAEQGFQRSLLPPRESLNPDSDGDLSDDYQPHPGVHTDDDDEMSVDEDYEDEDEEDDFDVTLRTPRRITRIANMSNMTSTSVDNSTGLSTVDHDSGFRTRTESESAVSDAASVVGHKRALPTPAEEDAPVRPPLKAKISDNGTIRAKPKTRTSIRPPPISRLNSRASESSASGLENRATVEITKKRRGATSPQRKEPVRRVTIRPIGAAVKPKTGSVTARPVTKKIAAIPRSTVRNSTIKPPIRPVVAKSKTGSSAESVKAGAVAD